MAIRFYTTINTSNTFYRQCINSSSTDQICHLIGKSFTLYWSHPFAQVTSTPLGCATSLFLYELNQFSSAWSKTAILHWWSGEHFFGPKCSVLRLYGHIFKPLLLPTSTHSFFEVLHPFSLKRHQQNIFFNIF